MVPEIAVRIDYWPNPVTTQGRRPVLARVGQRLDEAMAGTLTPPERAIAIVNGRQVERSDWHEVVLAADDRVTVRRTAHGFFIATQLLGLTGWAAFAVGLVISVAGMMVVNALTKPRTPKGNEADGQPTPQYSITGGANRARPYRSILLLLGEHRIFPDVVAQPYTEFDESNDQFLAQTFDFGLGENLVIAPGTEEVQIGDTALSNYEGVTTQVQATTVTLVAGNVDTIEGADLEYNVPVIRSTAGSTTSIAFDLSSRHYRSDNKGKLTGEAVEFLLEWRVRPSGTWNARTVQLVSPDGAEARNAVRRTFKYATGEASEWDCRVTLLTTHDEDDERLVFNTRWYALKAYQDDVADYTGRNSYAMHVKASGQLSGRIDSVNAVCQQHLPDWDGTNWSTRRATSNPASIYLAFLRGWFIEGNLVAGMGLPDSRIDFDSIQAWHDFCVEQELTCNLVLEGGGTRQNDLDTILQCGWGMIDRQTGQWGVIYDCSMFTAGVPEMGAIITPASVIAGSLSVSYDNDNLADEVIGEFVDAASDWQRNQLRRNVPNVTNPVRPVTVDLDGITDGEQAAKELNRMVAIQYYHIRAITWEMRLAEASYIPVGEVVGCTHGLVGLGVGGRITSVAADRLSFVAHTVEDPASGGHLWLWDLDGDVTAYTYTYTASTRTFAVSAALPAAADSSVEDPAAYRFMAFPTTRRTVAVRVTRKEPGDGDTVRFVARDEVEEYFDHRTSDLSWTPLDSRLQDRFALNLEVHEDEARTRIYTWSFETFQRIVGYQIRYSTTLTAEFADMLPLHEGMLSSSPYATNAPVAAGTYRFGIVGITSRGLQTQAVYAEATLQEWLTPGTRYKEVEVYQVVAVTDPAPARPGAEDGAFNFATGELTPPMGWVGPAFPEFTVAQKVYAVTATADSSGGLIWVPDEDDWIGPYIVDDPDDLDLIYRRSLTQPDTPAPSAATPAGWHTNVASVTGTQLANGPIWVSIGHRKRGETLFTWQQPTQLEGQNAVRYKEVEVYKVVAASANVPANPTATAESATHDWGSFDFNAGTLTPPTGWVGPAFPTYTADQKVYAVTATADSSEGFVWTPDSTDWLPSTPVAVGDASDLNIIYRRFLTAPTMAPAPSAGIPTGWFDLVGSVTGTQMANGPIYVSVGHRRRDAKLYTWQVPTQLEGQNAITYKELEAYKVQAVTAAVPATPGASGSYDFNMGTFTPPAGWVGPAFPTYTRDQVVYAVTATADNRAGGLQTWNAAAGDWVPNPPVVVGNVDDLDIIYRRYGTAPTSAPAASAGTPTGWYTNVADVPAELAGMDDGCGLLYYSVGQRVRGQSTYTWQLPIALEVRAITGVSRNAETGVVTLTFNDCTTDTFTLEGITASFMTDDAGNIDVTFSDGTTFEIPAGSVGRGIKTIVRTESTGVVTVTFDDDTTTTFTIMDGADGGTSEWIYRATTTGANPGTPATTTNQDEANDHVPTGWSDNPVSGNVVWVSKRTRSPGVTAFGKFSTPIQFNGTGVRSITKAADGTVTITYNDGTTDTFTVTDGKGISSITRNAAGLLTITFTDNTTTTFTVADGNGIKTIARNESTGVVTITYDDDTTATFTIMDGADGGTSEWIYRATTTDDVRPPTPANPSDRTTNDYVPANWFDNPVDGTYVWVSKRTRSPGANWGGFSTPVPFRGAPGVSWHSGEGVPAATLGNNGDFYLNTQNSDVYKKTAGEWAVIANIAGADGDAGGVWHVGSTVPGSDLGSQGHWYFRTGMSLEAGSIYRKTSATTWTKLFDVDGSATATWHSGSGRPAADLGSVGDFYFRTDNGYVYKKDALAQVADYGEPGGGGSTPTVTVTVSANDRTPTNGDTVTWSRSVGGTATGAITQQWQRSATGTGSWSNVGTGTTYAVSRATAGTYHVRCVVTRQGVSTTSAAVSATWSAEAATFDETTAPPTAPTVSTRGSTTLSGTVPAVAGATGYRVIISENTTFSTGGTDTLVNITGTTSWEATGLTADTTYYVAYQATDGTLYTPVSDLYATTSTTAAASVTVTVSVSANDETPTNGDTVTFRRVVGGTATGAITQQWQRSATGTGSWSNVGTGTTYAVSSSTATTWYVRCIVTRESVSATSDVVSATWSAATALPAPTGVQIATTGAVSAASTTATYYVTFEYDDNSSFSSPTKIYDTTLSGTHIGSSSIPASDRTGTVYLRARFTTVASDGGTQGPWSATASRTFTVAPTVTVTVSVNDATPDTGDAVTFSRVVGGTATGAITQQWQRSATGTGNWSNVHTGTTYTITSATATTWYVRCVVTRQVVSATSDVVSATWSGSTAAAPSAPRNVRAWISTHSSPLRGWVGLQAASGVTGPTGWKAHWQLSTSSNFSSPTDVYDNAEGTGLLALNWTLNSGVTITTSHHVRGRLTTEDDGTGAASAWVTGTIQTP